MQKDEEKTTGQKVDPAAEKEREKEAAVPPAAPDHKDDYLDIPLKNTGLPDRDLKKNLGCG